MTAPTHERVCVVSRISTARRFQYMFQRMTTRYAVCTSAPAHSARCSDDRIATERKTFSSFVRRFTYLFVCAMLFVPVPAPGVTYVGFETQVIASPAESVCLRAVRA